MVWHRLESSQANRLTSSGTRKLSSRATARPVTAPRSSSYKIAVGRGEADRGIFVDGVGYGSALIANRIAGVDAVVCQDPFCARLAREHTDSNVLCLGGKIIGSAIALEIVTVWMTTDFLDTDKYRQRVAKVREISERHLVPLDQLG